MIKDHALFLRGRNRDVDTDSWGTTIVLGTRLIESASPAKLAEVKDMILLFPIQGGPSSSSCL